jgi:type II secretory pathway component PulF
VQIKTKFGRDRDLFFLFSQLAQYFRSGVSPHVGLSNLAQRSRPRYQESLEAAAAAVGEGKRLSDVFERYPYLYPPDVVGTLRAGETAGYLGEACDRIADQLQMSNRLKRRLAWFLIILIGLVVAFPIVYAIVNASLSSIAAQDKAGGSLPVAGTLVTAVRVELVRILPIALPCLVAFIGFLFFWHSMPMRELRHRIVLGFPVLGGRVKAEAMARFTWAMGMVSRGGMSGQNTFLLAAETVPNLILRRKLVDAAKSMHEAERLSVALKRSQALPVEYAHIVETGETTGDVPRALADINRATDADFRARDGSAVTLVSFIFYGALGVLTLFMVAFLWRMYASGIITTLTTEEP